ncbi:hypothetical protein ACIGNX_09545 [Actinosynnema sp. NPDC053489]|uniref:hypothetical protein n=1 Tax=Actinosynnema sp. NPDC053489 TaxID=3363916 RepID=UPI0037CBC80D
MTAGTGVPAGRTRVGWGDLAWLTWRQHRWTVAGTAAVVLVAAATALGMAWHVDATGGTHELFGRFGYEGVSQVLAVLPAAFGLVVAVFWAAPLLAREYEQRTHLVVWSQDVTASRWLAAKVVLLGVTASALAAGLGLALGRLMDGINSLHREYALFHPFGHAAFEAAPHVQVGYAAFGFALGLAFGATTRRTVLSMGLTLVAYVVTRVAVAAFWRPYFRSPLREVQSYADYSGSYDGRVGTRWTVDGGYLDASGTEIGFPRACADIDGSAAYDKCMTDQGVRFFTEYHPVDRVAAFRLFEFAVFAALTAGLLVLAFTRVRRARRA